MFLNKEQATEQLQNLIQPVHPPISDTEPPRWFWLPFSHTEDDYDVLEWVRHPDNNWCSGKKHDFGLLLGKAIDYKTGDYARTVLLVLGIKVK